MKNLKKIIAISLFSVIGLLLVGCSGKPITLPTKSSSDYKKLKKYSYEISSSASGFQLLLFIPIDINDRQERAYMLLKEKAKGGYITDVKIKESWTYAFVGTSYKTTMTATVYPKEFK